MPRSGLVALMMAAAVVAAPAAQKPAASKLDALKQEAVADVESRAQFSQQMVDQIQPAIWLNKGVMEKFRPEMKKFYYDPSRYKTYLEQLGIKYPTVRAGSQ